MCYELLIPILLLLCEIYIILLTNKRSLTFSCHQLFVDFGLKWLPKKKAHNAIFLCPLQFYNMYQPESSIHMFEFVQDVVDLKQIKAEPEVPANDETDCKDYLCLNEKYHINIKNEEVQISDEKSNVIDPDLQEKLYNEEFNLENTKFENNSNGNWVTNIANIKNINDFTQKENSKALEQEKVDVLKSVNGFTFVEVKECFEDVYQQKIQQYCPYCKFEAPNDTILSKHISYEHFEKSHTKGIDGPETKKSKMTVTGSKTSTLRKKTFKCTLCSFIARAPYRMKQHFNQVHLELRSFSCLHCDYAAKNQCTLNSHVLNKHADKSGKVKTKMVCDLCGKEFTSKYNLKNHIRYMHLNIKEKCPECDYQAKDSRALKNHILSVHHPENLFRCHNCGYATPNKTVLKEHILGKHVFNTNSQRTFKCECCPHISKSKTSLEAHIREQHGKECPFTCSFCGYKYRFLNHLENHINVKHNKIDFICPICGQYSSKYKKKVCRHTYKAHGIKTDGEEMLGAHEKATLSPFSTFVKREVGEVQSFRCPHCDFAVEKNNNLRTHILSKHKDKSGILPTKHICHLCQKEFAYKRTLKKHIINLHL